MNGSPRSSACPRWHTLSADETAQRLASDLAAGLPEAEAARRLALHGPNRLIEGRRRGLGRIVLAQLSDLTVLILVAAAGIASFVGEPTDTGVILAIVLLNAALGAAQELRAERAMAALQALATPRARVRRGGGTASLPAAELVPGDLVELEAGGAVPADLRIVESAALRVDESALTGESQPVEKTAAALAAAEGADLALADRRNLAYKATLVTYGRGAGLVVATGMATELGRIAALLAAQKEGQTPLQKRLARLGKGLAMAAVALCAAFFAAGLLAGEEPMLMFLTALSLAVAAIPEALPAVVTVALALGARRMVRAHALIRRLPAVETLGSVTVICTDKTGTLTENRMRVEALATGALEESGAPDEAALPALFWDALALSHDAIRGADGRAHGDPTEIALLDRAAAAGVDKAVAEARLPRFAEIPFASERARMTTLHRLAGEGVEGALAFTKGAPEGVLAACADRLTPGGPADLDRAAVLATAHALARGGLRVLAFACRRFPTEPREITAESIERDLRFLGLAGLLDPPRPEARDAIALCRTAGIRVVMITGDHPATAGAIARRLGLLEEDCNGEIVTGPAFARLSPEELARQAAEARVYARVAPEQKLGLVEALQKNGEIVAMTGDGVNDAPALRRADIGVAMGKGGTDVAREAAAMILLDDHFATLVAAVREGRRIYDNVRKFVRYVLTCNSGEIWTLFLAPFLGLPVPLLPIHILWINLVTDGLPGLALATERAEPGLMERPPRPPGESLFAHGLWQQTVWAGLLMAGVTLFTEARAYPTGNAHWQSMVFTVLALSQMGNALAVRSERESLWTLGVTTNRPLLGATLLTLGLQLAVLYVPVLQRIFKTQPLSAGELVACLALSAVVFAGIETEKWMIRRGWLYRTQGERPGRPAPRGGN